MHAQPVAQELIWRGRVTIQPVTWARYYGESFNLLPFTLLHSRD